MSQTQTSSYFDLHTTGIGYLNRVRTVTPKKGDAFFACSIAALRGESTDVEFTRFDVRVSGAEARRIIEALREDVAAERKVLVSFRIGDIFIDTFVYDKDTKYHSKGDVGFMLKGRLLKISMAKVDGVVIDLARFADQPLAKAA